MKWVYNWRVISDSSGKEYVVSIADDGQFGCSCPAWTRRRIECKHIKRIKSSCRRDIDGVIDRFSIPLEFDLLTRDWVITGPECTDKRPIAAKCNANKDGYCTSELGPCKPIDPADTKKAVMSKVDELSEALKALDGVGEKGGKKKPAPAPTLMSLIIKNAQWRI